MGSVITLTVCSCSLLSSWPETKTDFGLLSFFSRNRFKMHRGLGWFILGQEQGPFVEKFILSQEQDSWTRTRGQSHGLMSGDMVKVKPK